MGNRNGIIDVVVKNIAVMTTKKDQTDTNKLVLAVENIVKDVRIFVKMVITKIGGSSRVVVDQTPSTNDVVDVFYNERSVSTNPRIDYIFFGTYSIEIRTISFNNAAVVDLSNTSPNQNTDGNRSIGMVKPAT